MALLTSKDIPKDAIVLDEFEATNYVWDEITTWQPSSDTWALRNSIYVLGGINSLTGILINSHFRRKLKLGRFGHMSSLLPITLMPGIFTALFHRHFVSTNMLLMKIETCPICYELRSAAVQLSFGMVYPMVLAPTSALMFASRYNTYRVPPLTKTPMEVFKLIKQFTKPLSGTLVFMSALQLVASSVLTYFEMKNHLTVRAKVLEIERQFDEDEVK